MKDLRAILTESSGMRLNHFEYTRIDSLEDETKLCLEDEFEISEIHQERFSIIVRRHIYCDPEDVMDMMVEFEIVRYLKEDCLEDLREYDIENQVKNDVDFYIDYNLNRASALISNITSSFGMNPLVTPPQFLKSKDGDY